MAKEEVAAATEAEEERARARVLETEAEGSAAEGSAGSEKAGEDSEEKGAVADEAADAARSHYSVSPGQQLLST